MENLGVWLTLGGFVLAVISAIIGTTWRLQNAINMGNASNTAMITTLNNTFQATISMVEDRINEDWKQKAGEIDKSFNGLISAFSGFQVYVEKEFVSKNSFRSVMDQNAADRKEMKADIMGAFGDLKRQIDVLQQAVNRMQGQGA